MGLVRGGHDAPAGGEFEDMDDNLSDEVVTGKVERADEHSRVAAAKPVKQVEDAVQQEAPAASQTKEVAVAAPAAGALVPIGKLELSTNLSKLRNQFENSGIDIGFGTFPRVKIEAGVICSDGDQEAGSYLDLEVMSFTSSFIITPNDDNAPTTLARYSDDGEIIRSTDEWNGRPCVDYVEYLKDTHQYENAGIREYLNLYGAVVTSEKPFFEDEIVCVQCSPQALQRWNRHLINHARRVKLGKVQDSDAPLVRIGVEKGKSGTKSYFFFTFSNVPNAA